MLPRRSSHRCRQPFFKLGSVCFAVETADRRELFSFYATEFARDISLSVMSNFQFRKEEISGLQNRNGSHDRPQLQSRQSYS
jgi:hypothetical protein